MKYKIKGMKYNAKHDKPKRSTVNTNATTSSKRTYSIRSTLIVSILSICLIPLVIATAVFSVFSSGLTYNTFTNSGTLLTETAVNMIDTKIQFYKDTLDSIIEHNSFDPTVDTDLESVISTLASVVNGDVSILNMYYSSTEGHFVSALGEELPEDIDPRDLKGYKDCMEKPEEFFYISPYEDIITHDLVLTLARAVMKNGKFMGTLFIDASLTSLSPQFESIRYGKEGSLIIVDDTGTVVISTDHDMLTTTQPTEYPAWDKIMSTESGSVRFTYDGVKYTTVYNTGATNGWKYLLRLPSAEIVSAQRQFLTYSVIQFIIMALICAAMIFFLTRALCKPIFAIKDYITENAKGDFSKQLKLNTFVKEFDLLSVDLNNMQNSISNVMTNFNASIEHLEESASVALSDSKEIATSIEHISETINEISHGSTESATGVETITHHMDNLSTNMEQIKDATDTVNQMAQKTNLLGEDGKTIIESVKHSSAQTKHSTSEVYTAINEVASKISDISLMSTTISSITEQTTLLALNASIEAARAGEAGKGFAVVANEINKLADETALSAKQINDIVKTIQDFVEKAVEKVSETTSIVQEQEDAVNHSEGIFVEIINAVQTLSKEVNDITHKINNVNQMKSEIQEEVEGLSAIFEETASGAEEVASYSTNIKSSSSQFVTVISRLNELADELQEHINHFKY